MNQLDELQTAVTEMLVLIAGTPAPYAEQLAQQFGRICGLYAAQAREVQRALDRSSAQMCQLLEDVRLGVAYTTFDLEATRRERDQLRGSG